MSHTITTARLQLIPLNLNQLELIAQSIERFETSLHIAVMRTWMTERVHRAIHMKLDKMQKADAARQRSVTAMGGTYPPMLYIEV
jgi:hypothetical protein